MKLNSIIVVVKFSSVLLASSFFLMGMLVNSEPVILISGIYIISYIIYRKINQIHMQYTAFKNLPKQFKDLSTKFNDKKNNENKGYQ